MSVIEHQVVEAAKETASSKKEKSTSQDEISSKEFKSPGLFSDEEIILDEILSCDVDNITPMNAMSLISRWKKSLSGR